MSKFDCWICRDEGEYGGCKKCNKIKSEKADAQEAIENKKFNSVVVPPQYQNKAWDSNTLRMSKPELDGSDNYFDRYVKQLEKAHSDFSSGKLPETSAIVIAPRKFSKMTWAYSCMQLAITYGFTTVPILDTQQLKKFLIISEERPWSSYLKIFNFGYEDILTCDVMFLTVSKGEYKYTAWEVIDTILDMRSRLGLITIVLSRFNLQEISKYDKYNRFKSIVDREENPLRYPAIIPYLDGTMGEVI